MLTRVGRGPISESTYCSAASPPLPPAGALAESGKAAPEMRGAARALADVLALVGEVSDVSVSVDDESEDDGGRPLPPLPFAASRFVSLDIGSCADDEVAVLELVMIEMDGLPGRPGRRPDPLMLLDCTRQS